VSVKLKDLDGVNAFFELDEPLYALGFFWLIFGDVPRAVEIGVAAGGHC
jgi:hypothetical protein